MSIRWYQNTIKLWLNFQLLTGNISFVPLRAQPASRSLCQTMKLQIVQVLGKDLISRYFEIKMIDLMS